MLFSFLVKKEKNTKYFKKSKKKNLKSTRLICTIIKLSAAGTAGQVNQYCLHTPYSRSYLLNSYFISLHYIIIYSPEENF